MGDIGIQFLPLLGLLAIVGVGVLVAMGRRGRRSEIVRVADGLGVDRQMLIEQRVANDGPSTGAAYLLWFFLGAIGGHRWYLGRPGTALLTILAWCCFVAPGLIWWVLDGFALGGMVRAERATLRNRLILEAGAMTAATAASAAA